ncbi:MAG: calcium/sodium antiporter [Burkholderiaceae bacterium]
MLLPTLAILAGLALLVWSADRFVDGASATAHHFAMPPLLVGMVIVGFGTSAPELVVSTNAALQGNPGLALGNGWGSNIANIALILGITALVKPIAVHSLILHKELPILAGVTAVAGYLAWDQALLQTDGLILLGVFAALMTWSVVAGLRSGPDALGEETATELQAHAMPLWRSLTWLVLGLGLLIVSSRLLVWGAVSVAQALGVSDLVIGLTVVAVGTSLPELASCVAAARKGEHDLALGNVLGSNLFNTLAVVGVAATIAPMDVPAEAIGRDFLIMAALTVALFVMGWGWRGRPGRINRVEASVLLLAYMAYTAVLLRSLAQPS